MEKRATEVTELIELNNVKIGKQFNQWQSEQE